MSSMNQAGIPDIHIAHCGMAAWLELKFVPKLPKREGSNVLSRHKFSGEQLTFMRKATSQGIVALGVIGYSEGGDVWVVVIAEQAIEKDGSVTLASLREHQAIKLGPAFGAAFLRRIHPLS
jgi:hypothetical protein